MPELANDAVANVQGLGDALEARCRSSLHRELPVPLRGVCEGIAKEVAEKLGASVAAQLLYGSCLWRGTTEGVPDFFVFVDRYDEVYPRLAPRLANRWLAPNVYPLFDPEHPGQLRAKYSVFSVADLERATDFRCLHSFLWARLCQPTAFVTLRDDTSEAAVVRAAARSVTTLLSLGLARAPAGGGDPEISSLWAAGFDATYRAEWRFERRTRSLELLDSDPRYYRGVGEAGLERLRKSGRGDPADREVLRKWAIRRRTGKALAALRLAKNAALFGDFLPYALWKMERHTGRRIEVSEAQRRHPFLLGGPILYRVLRAKWLR